MLQFRDVDLRRFRVCCLSRLLQSLSADTLARKDCEDGTCYEGLCAGDRVYSTDGTCGYDYGDRLCAGKWGDCCNRHGRCGTGDSFCGESVCQSGNCD